MTERPDITIPEEAIEAACAAHEENEGWEREAGVRAAVAAAAPLIVAAAFEQYAATIDYDHVRSKTTRPGGRLTPVDLVREDLLRLAAELRGGAQ
jgi:hypothetical protein